jgi:hypothetical protein
MPLCICLLLVQFCVLYKTVCWEWMDLMVQRVHINSLQMALHWRAKLVCDVLLEGKTPFSSHPTYIPQF